MTGKKLKGRKRPDISKRLIGHTVSKETRIKIGLANKGRKHTEEHKKKILESRKNNGKPWHSKESRRKISIANSGKRNSFYGKKHTEESKRKISLSGKGRKQSEESKRKMSISSKGQIAWNKGKNYEQLFGEERAKEIKRKVAKASWKGGVSFEPYGIKFNNYLREQIRKRDQFRCQECFRHQSELRTKTNKSYKLHVHHIDFNKQNNKSNNLISLCRSCHMKTNWDRSKWIGYYQNRVMFG